MASPAATGPGGTHFEAKVGGFYLLALLLDVEPRGLPGARIERVQFQGANNGYPLDDVIIHARTTDGQRATAQIQAKRKISFSPSDSVFRDVAEQIAKAITAGKVNESDYDVMCIATSQSSRQIDSSYQEVLRWARQSESSDSFFKKISRPNAANEGMRTFVSTLADHLREFGVPPDNETVWKTLRRMVILVFDFAEEGQSEILVRDRCARALDPGEQAKAGALWTSLCDIAQTVATSGGDIAIDRLRDVVSNTYGYKLAGLRQNHSARAALWEASKAALLDIRNSVGSVTLARRTLFDSINVNLEHARYLEIRGDAGVGKSGLLRALAEQVAIESNVIVLSGIRTIPRGWTALRSTIGFNGTVNELLVDLASSGGATLFLDGVDFFEEAERVTAIDLIRAAAQIPGFRVVVTARQSFGIDEPSWLPAEALRILGPSPRIVIEELNAAEIDELRDAAPELSPLLADSHRARDVVRNLFRLDRLVQRGRGEPIPYTEADMARQWWVTGDGRNDSRMRDRTRILRDLSEKVLNGAIGPLKTSPYPAGPLDELVRSGSLRELRAEIMNFRHDVFRDWAVGNLLYENSDKILDLPLTRPAPPSLFRGVEIAARISIQESADSESWKRILAFASRAGAHGSWRRAVLMALVHSESGADLLTRVSDELLANSGQLLGELARTLMATEVTRVGELLAGFGINLPAALENAPLPVAPAWRRLIDWLLALGERLPSEIIPDVANLYALYAAMMRSIDPIVVQLLHEFYSWLIELEGGPLTYPVMQKPRLRGSIGIERNSFLDFLRSSFCHLCSVTPALANEYLRFLLSDVQEKRYSIQAVVLTPGGLTKVAPEALADLTAAALIEPYKGQRPRSYGQSEPFSFLDSKFLSPSPARGPFFELLLYAPQTGISLIQKLVLHACTFNRKPTAKENYVALEFDDGERRFPYIGSYFWSRGANGLYSVTSALMALEAWGHYRLDAGETVDRVIADILSEKEVPAAFLLLAVDIVLSHWPKSRHAGIAFVGCPELLAWDRERQAHDRLGTYKTGFGEQEPRSLVNREFLDKRDSRQLTLEETLPHYLLNGPPSDADAVRARLQRAAVRLGPYERNSSFADPRFMVCHALNELDIRNWQTQVVTDANGGERQVRVYIAPKNESDHLQPIQDEVASNVNDANLRGEISFALKTPAKSTVDLVTRAVSWAKGLDKSGKPQPDFDHSILMAAMLLARDGDDGQFLQYRTWAEQQFRAAVALPEDSVHRFRNILRFNPKGIGVAGLVYAIRRQGGLCSARMLLELAAEGDPAVAHGFGATMKTLEEIDGRLPKALLRCAFAGNIRPHFRRYDEDAESKDKREREIAERRAHAVQAEWHWLQGNEVEPPWPEFPEERPVVREPLTLSDKPRNRPSKVEGPAYFYADHQAAAVWLDNFAGTQLIAPDWLQPIAREYSDWTTKLNGGGLDSRAELSRQPEGWNRAYYRLVAGITHALSAAEMNELCIAPVVSLPDDSFLDVIADFLFYLDAIYFENKGLAASELLQVRIAFATRLQTTSQWKYLCLRPGYGIEIHLGPAIGAMFLSLHVPGQPPRCYVTAIGIPRAEPLMSLLADISGKAPCLYIALLVLGVATASPDHPFVTLCVQTMKACMQRFPNDTSLWVDYGVGKQFCAWLKSVLEKFGASLLNEGDARSVIEQLLSDLIRLGVAEATQLEAKLLEISVSPSKD